MYDIVYGDCKIEVKTSAYLQNWNLENGRLSTISFGIAPTKEWNPETRKYAGEPKRHADMYVFCVLNCKVAENVEPLNLDQWDFYVILTTKLPPKKHVSLSFLKDELLLHEVKYDSLKAAIDKVLQDATRAGDGAQRKEPGTERSAVPGFERVRLDSSADCAALRPPLFSVIPLLLIPN